MCISPRLKLNPKYLPNNKNGGIAPPLLDDRVKYVPIGCGVCYECLKRKSNQWKVRLYEAYRDWETDRKSTRLNSSHITRARMPSSA